jgi:predicted nucleic acid-binding protein
MIVADSTYLVEGLLKDASLLENELIVAPDLALHEVANSIWKHEVLLKDVEDGQKYINILFELVASGAVQLVRSDEKIARRAYEIAVKKKSTFYDAIFAALAMELELELKTLDEKQRSLLR